MKCKLNLYFSHSAGGMFSVCLGFFLSGFPKCVSLPLICMANTVVLLFMEQFLFFLYGHLERDTK